MLRSRVVLFCVMAVLAGTGASLRQPRAGAGNGAPPARMLPLPFHYDLYTFRGSGGRTAVVAAFAVSAGLLREEDAGRGIRYRFDVSLVLADTARRWVARRDDSVFVYFRRPLLAEHLLYTQLEMQAAPSGTTLHRVIMTDATEPGIGQLYGSSFPIPDYSGRHLMLSDIALGLPVNQGGWRRGDVTIALLPTADFPASAFDVFYEIYNLPAGHRYTTEIAVESALPGQVRPVRLRFESRSGAHDDVVQELRRVETSLARGRYRITVTISDVTSGESASRSRTFEVRGWARGTTLVAALPRGSLP